MQLKEFSLLSPVLESADVFQAIETVIPPDVIEQTLGHTNSIEERVSQTAITVSSLSSNRHEFVVIGLNGNRPQEFGQWFKQTVDAIGTVLESTQ